MGERGEGTRRQSCGIKYFTLVHCFLGKSGEIGSVEKLPFFLPPEANRPRAKVKETKGSERPNAVLAAINTSRADQRTAGAYAGDFPCTRYDCPPGSRVY